MNRHPSIGSIGIGVLVGMVAGATAATMFSEPKTWRSTKRCARQTLRSMEDLLMDMKRKMF